MQPEQQAASLQSVRARARKLQQQLPQQQARARKLRHLESVFNTVFGGFSNAMDGFSNAVGSTGDQDGVVSVSVGGAGPQSSSAVSSSGPGGSERFAVASIGCDAEASELLLGA